MRILALTGDPSLEVALGMIDDWEVQSVGSVDAVVEHAGAGVLLIGQATTEDGLRVASEASERGVAIPIVVVGDEGAEDAVATVVLRPFSLDDLREAVDRAVAAAGAEAAAPPEQDEEEHAPEPEAPPVSEEQAPGAGADDGPPDPSPEADSDGDLEGVDLAEVRSLPVPPRPTPVATEPGGGAALRLVKEPPARDPEPEKAEPEVAEAPPASPEAPPASPAPVESPAPAQPSSPREREAARPSARPAPAARDRKRFGKRRAREAAPESDDPMDRRLLEAARAAHIISGILDELPMLRDVAGLAAALIGEIEARFAPETAAIYVRRGSSFVPVAGHDLSLAEKRLDVPDTHALIAELEGEGEAILIAPVDLARGVVAGIAGARTEALLAAPVTVDGVCSAIIVIGRDDFDDDDLDACDLLAREAAAGLTVASAIDALSPGGSED